MDELSSYSIGRSLGILVLLLVVGGCHRKADVKSAPDASKQDVEATPDAVAEEKSPIERVERVVLAFAESTSCNVRLGQTIPLVPTSSDQPYRKVKYMVIWRGGPDCSGLSNYLPTNVAIVRLQYDRDSFYVDLDRSEPMASIQLGAMGGGKVIGHTKDSVTFVGAAYADDDPRCCPSMKLRYTIKERSNGDWEVVKQDKFRPDASP